MKTVSINELNSGDRLARDLRMDDGSLVLGKGAQLSDSLIIRFERMGINEVVVESQDDEGGGDLEGQLVALDHRFEGHENDSLMMELKQVVKDLIVSETGETGEAGS